MKRYYIGGMRRALAKKRGMTLAEYNKLGEKDPSTDREVDDYQTELGKKKNNIIVDTTKLTIKQVFEKMSAEIKQYAKKF